MSVHANSFGSSANLVTLADFNPDSTRQQPSIFTLTGLASIDYYQYLENNSAMPENPVLDVEYFIVGGGGGGGGGQATNGPGGGGGGGEVSRGHFKLYPGDTISWDCGAGGAAGSAGGTGSNGSPSSFSINGQQICQVNGGGGGGGANSSSTLDGNSGGSGGGAAAWRGGTQNAITATGNGGASVKYSLDGYGNPGNPSSSKGAGGGGGAITSKSLEKRISADPSTQYNQLMSGGHEVTFKGIGVFSTSSFFGNRFLGQGGGGGAGAYDFRTNNGNPYNLSEIGGHAGKLTSGYGAATLQAASHSQSSQIFFGAGGGGGSTSSAANGTAGALILKFRRVSRLFTDMFNGVSLTNGSRVASIGTTSSSTSASIDGVTADQRRSIFLGGYNVSLDHADARNNVSTALTATSYYGNNASEKICGEDVNLWHCMSSSNYVTQLEYNDSFPYNYTTQFPEHSQDVTDGMTIDVWVHPSSYSTQLGIFYIVSPTSASSYTWAYFNRSSGSYINQIIFGAGTTASSYRAYITQTTGMKALRGNMIHFTATINRNNNELKVYLDGELRDTVTGASSSIAAFFAPDTNGRTTYQFDRLARTFSYPNAVYCSFARARIFGGVATDDDVLRRYTVEKSKYVNPNRTINYV